MCFDEQTVMTRLYKIFGGPHLADGRLSFSGHGVGFGHDPGQQNLSVCYLQGDAQNFYLGL
jgi:hypothetical protein